MKIFFFLFSFLFPFFFFSQTWEEIGPFYGQDKKGNYMHSMGLVNALWVDPENQDIIVMATNTSGIWKTVNRGKSWFCVTQDHSFIPGMGVCNFSQNPKNKNELIAGISNITYKHDDYGAKLLISKDAGSTWKFLEGFDNENWQDIFTKVQFVNEKEIYVSTQTELRHSVDKGKTWNVIFKLDNNEPYVENQNQDIVDFSILNKQTILLTANQKWGGTSQAWRTTNGGKTWDLLINKNLLKPFPGAKIHCSKLSEPINDTCILGVNNWDEIYFYKITNNAQTIHFIGKIKLDYETGDAKSSKFEIEMSRKYPGKLHLGFIEFFKWDSINGLTMLSPGGNISAYEHDDVRSMLVLENKNKEEYLLMGNDGGISAYYPESKKFESLNGYKLPTIQVYNMGLSQFNNYKILIGTQDNGTYQYTDSNKTWNWIAGGDGGASWLSYKGDKEFYCANASLTFKKDNTPIGTKYYSPNSAKSGWFLDFPAEVKSDETTLVIGSNRKRDAAGATLFIQNTDSNKPKIQLEIDGVEQIEEIEISDQDENLIYIASGEFAAQNNTKKMLLKSNDGGANFIDLTKSIVYTANYTDTILLQDLLSYRNVSDIEIDPLDNNIIFVTLTGVVSYPMWSNFKQHIKVLRSFDGGYSWEDFSKGLPTRIPAYSLVRYDGADELIFCGTDDGIYYRSKTNNSWQPFNDGFPKNITVTDLKINYCTQELFASTYGRGVWKIKLPAYTKAQFKITNNTQLNKDMHIKTNLEIKPKVTLTIKANVIIANGCKIILAPKSTLLIDGGTLSKKCDSNWDIIEVEEKRFLFFFKRKKGKIILLNNGKLIKE